MSVATYQGLTKESYRTALCGLQNYSLELYSRDGEVPSWMEQEISRVHYVLDNWEQLSDGSNEQTGQGDSTECQ